MWNESFVTIYPFLCLISLFTTVLCCQKMVLPEWMDSMRYRSKHTNLTHICGITSLTLHITFTLNWKSIFEFGIAWNSTFYLAVYFHFFLRLKSFTNWIWLEVTWILNYFFDKKPQHMNSLINSNWVCRVCIFFPAREGLNFNSFSWNSKLEIYSIFNRAILRSFY